MRSASLALLSLAVLATTLSAATTHSRRHPTSSHAIAKPSSKGSVKPASLKTSSKTGKRTSKAKTRIIGQRSIDDERATQIQSALIKAGYLSGTPSGHWDSESEAAMQKVQSDNGWQTKLVPDSRALIKLGLGPNSSPGESLAKPPALGGSSSSTVADQ